nr:MobA/MobL family protein [Moraxella osloensis]
MAIFMATMKSISRGSGQSAIASAAYRAGEKLQDARYGKVQDYSKKEGVLSKEIIFPSALKNQTSIDRNSLWNKAEEAEKRKDSRVAREWIVNLPHELNEKQREQLAHEFSQKLADKYNIIADCCIHQPSDKEVARGADPRNFHAHIMLTTRQVHLTADGNIVLGEKAAIELSDKKRKSLGLERVSDEIVELRQLWEQTANTKLAEIGCELIDSRSYKERGLDIEPQIKMGKNATQLKRRTGKDTPVHEINTLIKERNAAASMVQELKLERERQEQERQQQLRLEEERQEKQRKADEQQRIAEFNKQTERANTAIARSKQRITATKRTTDETEQDLEGAIPDPKRYFNGLSQLRLLCEQIKSKFDDTEQTIDRSSRLVNGTERLISETKQTIAATNQDIEKLTQARKEQERQEKQRKADEQQRIAEFNRQTERADTAIARSKQRIDEQQSEIKRAAELIERAARLIKQVKELDYRDIGRKFLEHAVAATEAPKNEYRDYQLAANELLKVYKPLSGDEVKRRFEASHYNNETQLVMPTSRQNTPLFSVYSCGLISVNTYELRDLTKTYCKRTYFELADIAEVKFHGSELSFKKIDVDLNIESFNKHGVQTAFEASERYKLNPLSPAELKPQPSQTNRPRTDRSNERINSQDDGPSFGF